MCYENSNSGTARVSDQQREARKRFGPSQIAQVALFVSVIFASHVHANSPRTQSSPTGWMIASEANC